MSKNRTPMGVHLGKVIKGNIIQAEYIPSQNPRYRYSPFIEALPTMLTDEQAMKKMSRYPGYNKEDRFAPPLHRIDYVQTLSSYFQPLPIHLKLAQSISRVIRNGYFVRNPLSAAWKKQIRSAFPKMDWDESKPNDQPLIFSTSSGMVVCGVSGIGKSIGIVHVLSLFPQVIIHTEYEGEPLIHTQLVWLYLECPQDGSPRGLCLSFFAVIDELLGTNYFERFIGARMGVDELFIRMKSIAAVLGLGVLVIDEIQRLDRSKGGGAEQIEDFFIQLNNDFGVPVIQVGTPDALPFITKKFAFARKNTGQGSFIMSNMQNNTDWKYFAKYLLEYQWTCPASPETDELIDTLYEESQGLPDIAVKLYQIVQWSIIGTENEAVTPALIRKMAKECIKLVQPALAAMKSGDPDQLAAFKDVFIPNETLDEYLQRAGERITMSGTMATLRNLRQTLKSTAPARANDTVLTDIAKWLVDAGIKPEAAYDCAEKALNRHAAEYDLSKVYQDAWSILKESKSDAAETCQPSIKEQKNIKVPLSGDMRGIISSVKKSKTSNYDALKSAGILKDASEFLNM